MEYENARWTMGSSTKHPKDSKKEAMNLLRAFSKHLTFEPICLGAFNDARECLFKMDG